VEVLAFFLVLWCVYLSDVVWWTTSDRLILTGSRVGEFHVHRGPSLQVRDGKGFVATSLMPPFRYSFECELDGASESPSKFLRPAQIERLTTRALSLAASLRVLGEVLWIYLFVIVPIAIATLGLLPTWLPLLAVLFGWLLIIVVFYRHAWRRLYKDTPSGWRSDAVLMLLSPPGAIRAADKLTRRALRSSGLRVTSAIASPQEFCRIARLMYFDQDTPPSAAVQAEINALLDTRGLRAMFDTGPRPEPGMLGFCRRCHSQVMRASGRCPDCVDLPIIPFADRPGADLVI
jgi:hypothetical protein